MIKRNKVITNTDTIRFTKEGYEKLKQEQEDLKASRPATVDDLRKAREMGDLSENGYYKASRAKLSWIDGRLARLKYYLKIAEIVEEDTATSSGAGIGKTVTVSDGTKELVYELVGDLEANPSEGKISLLSPLGKAMEGKQKGQVAELETPRGKIVYTIIAIK